MNRNNILLVVFACAVLCAGCGTKNEPPAKPIEQPVVKTAPVLPEKPVVKNTPAKTSPAKIDIYGSNENNDIPLSAIVQISKLPQNIKDIINNQIKNSEVYYLNVQKDKVIIIKEVVDEADRFTRHDFEIISVSIPDGKIHRETDFPVKMSNDDSETEKWKYEVVDGDMVVPSNHTSLNENGSVRTIESWFYGDDEVKYKVTDGDGKILSLRKTSKSDGGNWRDEHLFYDKDGKTALNVSFAYEDNHIARFTYYNPASPETSVTMVNEYKDVDKVKETIYSSDYKLQNSYVSVYEDGERKAIKVFDDKNNETGEYLAE